MHVTVVMIIFTVKMMGHDGSPAAISTAREQP